jgi:hypothetical protein
MTTTLEIPMDGGISRKTLKGIGRYMLGNTIAAILLLGVFQPPLPILLLILTFCLSLNALPILWALKHPADPTSPKHSLEQFQRTLTRKRLVLLFTLFLTTPLIWIVLRVALPIPDFTISVVTIFIFVGGLYWIFLGTNHKH